MPDTPIGNGKITTKEFYEMQMLTNTAVTTLSIKIDNINAKIDELCKAESTIDTKLSNTNSRMDGLVSWKAFGIVISIIVVTFSALTGWLASIIL